MRVIQKRADELRPGDDVALLMGGPMSAPNLKERLVMLRFNGADLGNDGIAFGRLAHAGRAPLTDIRYFRPDDSVNVEAPDELTPAQQHADELREMLWRAANFMRGRASFTEIEAEARALLERIEPPAPPTLEEALAALTNLLQPAIGPAQLEHARDILSRARKAGVIPRD